MMRSVATASVTHYCSCLFLACMCLLGVGGCADDQVGATETIQRDLEDEYDVYEVVIDAVIEGHRYIGLETIVVKSKTSLPTWIEYPPNPFPREREIPLDRAKGLSEDFTTKNATPHLLRCEYLDFDEKCALISQKAWDDLFEYVEGKSIGQQIDEAWTRFYELYPNSPGLITLSRVGFSTAGEEALVYIGLQAESLVGVGYYCLLWWHDDVWVVDVLSMIWIS